MILLIHIVSALSSSLLAAYAFFSPSQSRIRLAASLGALTLITGFDLVWSNLGSPSSNLTETCIMGLGYFAFVTVALVSAERKLARAAIQK